MVTGVPVFTFGLIADVQYANKADAGIEDRKQHYKSSATKLGKAVQHLNSTESDVSFVLSLGDCIDGNDDESKTVKDLERVATEFDKLTTKCHHVIGNHDLRVPRGMLHKRLGIPSTSYYTVDIAEGWRLIVLDTTELSTHSGYPEDSWQAKETAEYVKTADLESAVNGAKWNGGITGTQKAWLAEQLKTAEAGGVRCLVASHHPIGTGAGRDTHHAWQAGDIETMLNASSSVVAVFSGHDHPGGYACVDGTHYLVPEAMLESPEDSNAYSFVRVFKDFLVVQGHGVVTSHTCRFK